MKSIICLIVMLAIANYTYQAVCTSAITNFCQSCSAGTCNSCYNYGKGQYADKVYSTSTSVVCTGAMPTTWKVTNCLVNAYFSNANLNAATVVGNSNHPRCVRCDGYSIIHYTTTATTETCTNTSPNANCTAITNCMATICDTTATTKTCAQCNSGTYPTYTSGTISACSSTGTAITNCEYYTHNGTSQLCGQCTSGNSVAYGGASCVTFADTGCMQLQSGNTNCDTCKYNYAFNAATCTFKSYMTYIAGLVSFVILLALQ